MQRRRGSLLLPRILLVAAAMVGAAFVAPTSAVSAQVTASDTDSAGPKPKVGPLSELEGPKPEKEVWNAVDTTLKIAKPSAFTKLRAKAVKNGKVQVIVGLRMSHTAEGGLSATAAQTQRAMIGLRTAQIKAAVAGIDGKGARVVNTFEYVPFVALELTPVALDRLQASGLAASIETDTLAKPTLDKSQHLVEAVESWSVGRNGGGRGVAILDTGVQKSHPFLRKANGTPKVVAEACYAANGTCPGGRTVSTSAGSGAPCLGTDQCSHGTHVAGIAAGRGPNFSGVGKESTIVALRVFSVFRGSGTCGGPSVCALSFTSDQIKGLERVYALRSAARIASANMSLGSADTYSRPCDTDPRKRIIDTLRSVGIATVISSGNSSSNSGVSAPGCISTAVTVGATSKSDTVASFSNSSSYVDLLAPGVGIVSSVPGNRYARFDGTSMAAPHVAGAWAVLKGTAPKASVATILSALQASGKGVRDGDNGVLKRRIRILSAGARLYDSGLRYSATYSAPNLDMYSVGVGLARRNGGPASATFRMGGIPRGYKPYAARLVWTTIGGPDRAVTFAGKQVIGTLVGVSRPTCTNLNTGQPNRTYIAAVSVPRNGNYGISGVGYGNIDGQGASLITMFAGAGTKGRINIRAGAVSALPTNGSLGTYVTTSGNGNHLRLPGLHYGVGDGASTKSERSLHFNGSPVTPVNYFRSSDGRSWDDDRRNMAKGLVPRGTANRPIQLVVGSDCLVMSYAAISTKTSG
jgi:hypothetical protein